MKYNNWIKMMRILAVLAGFFNLTSCEDDLVTDLVDKSRYEVSDQSYAFLNNAQGLNKYMVDLYNAEDENVSLCVRLSKPVKVATNWTLKIDESLLSDYNKEHETDFSGVSVFFGLVREWQYGNNPRGQAKFRAGADNAGIRRRIGKRQVVYPSGTRGDRFKWGGAL